MSTPRKYVYRFSQQHTEGNATMKALLGGKGANLAEMAALGLPVPPGFTITTEACAAYYRDQQHFMDLLWPEVMEHLRLTEQTMGRRFGDESHPLLFSCRSGAPISMPGMMDTVLNIGLHDGNVEGFGAAISDVRGAWDSYRRLIQMFGDVVMGVNEEHFAEALDALKREHGVHYDYELSADALRRLVGEYQAIVLRDTGRPFPQQPLEQLRLAAEAVFASWHNERARTYRRLNKIADDLGTAVNIQSMVFGNLGMTSGTGVAFTRNPSTGERHFYGEYLINAQGEDVVAGIRTPQPLETLRDSLPECYQQLLDMFARLESHYREMQDIEFTVQEGKVYILQTRTGKRTGHAAFRIAIEMVEEGIIDEKTALKRVNGDQLSQLLHPEFADFLGLQAARERGHSTEDLAANFELNAVEVAECLAAKVVGKGLPASPGAATGQVVFDAETAVAWAHAGHKVILARNETSPEDIAGMHASEGILTARGGLTSHAAVVARGQGKCCVAGFGELEISYKERKATVGEVEIRQGDWLSINGTTGQVIVGRVPRRPSEIVQVLDGKQPAESSKMYQLYARLMGWADQYRRLRVRANSETPEDTAMALRFGAEGIGLCRTEHMFFGAERILHFRRMILAQDETQRRAALTELLPYQRADFYEILRLMAGKPVTIRLLDPPLHEFLPHGEKEQAELAAEAGLSLKEVQVFVEKLAEANPMMGHRGCRLAVTYPEICEMQARAIFEAVVQLTREGVAVHPEVMIPLTVTVKELSLLKEIIDRVASLVRIESGVNFSYLVGTMIETPRAALTAGEIATVAEFFSFGTNDLTQMTYGFSRDDAGRFLPAYVEARILPDDPFATLDQKGVGRLVEMAVREGLAARKHLHTGICGEHGGDPESVEFCHRTGLDYVSCSPFRIPVARLHAAKAALAG